METQPSLVRPDRIAVLHPVTLVDLDRSRVILPGDTEHDDTVGFRHALGQVVALVFGMISDPGNHVTGKFKNGLVEFLLARIALDDAFHEAVDSQTINVSHCFIPL